MFRTLIRVGAAALLLFAVRMADPWEARGAPIDMNPGNDSGGFDIRIRPRDIWPPVPVTDLRAISGAEKQALLQWTAPHHNFGVMPVPGEGVSSYAIRLATFSVADVGNSTSAWFSAAQVVDQSLTPLLPGGLQSLLTSLQPATTYWFGLKSVDAAVFVSEIDDRSLSVVDQASVAVKGIAPVTDLTGLPGGTGEVDLVWTHPSRVGQFDPSLYEIRASSAGQIADDAQFAAALPLTAFSPSEPPAPAAPSSTAAFTVTGLLPGVTYYFAVRARDSGMPPFVGAWRSSATLNFNPFNFARAGFAPNPPNSVTNLTALPGALSGEIALTWTAPENSNGVALERYELRLNTQSVQGVGGSTTAWYALSDSTSVMVIDGSPPGVDISTEIGGLNSSLQYYFSVKGIDISGGVSDADDGAVSVLGQARSFPRPTPPIVNLTATPGLLSGSIALEWTVPDAQGLVDPRSYDIRASSTANINDDSDFDAAQPLSAFTQTETPAPGTSGAVEFLTVTGLTPRATYYFALRVVDSNNPPVSSIWLRDLGENINVQNFAPAHFISNPPAAITDLTALVGAGRGEVSLAWTAPLNENFVAISSYALYGATVPAQGFPGGINSWEAAASSRVYFPAAIPGAAESFVFTGLTAAEEYFFSARSIDEAGDISPADTAAQSGLNQNRAFAQGVGDLRDLAAAPGVPSGSIALSWTTPNAAGVFAPLSYDIRASTAANIEDEAQFAAAAPLTAFTQTPLPDYTTPGLPAALQVTGLAPFATYYFAMRVFDSSSPVNTNEWLRDAGLDLNTTNFSVPNFIAGPPDAVTDLTALTGDSTGRIELAWTAPLNPNFVPVSSYTVAFATTSIAELGGDATAWFVLASSQIVVAPAAAPGSLESLSLTGLEPGAEYFFAVRSVDETGFVSPVDDRAAPDKQNDPARARAYGVQRVTDLSAAIGADAGKVDLTWTAPHRAGVAAPGAYIIRASSISNIDDDAAFAAAAPLSAFSQTPTPALAAGGSGESLTVTGLLSFTTYYFAIRVEDSSAPVKNEGVWLRRPDFGENAVNFAAGSFFAHPPEPVTDLTASPFGPVEGRIQLSWTAPLNINGIPITHYQLRLATVPVTAAPFLGDTTAWFDAAAAGETIVSPAGQPGALENAVVEGLHPGNTVYFTVRAVDALDELGVFDTATLALAQVSTRSFNAAPATPTGLTAVEGTLAVNLGWAELPDGLGGKGLDFAFYRLQRSTDDAEFVSIATGPAVFHQDIPLKAFTSYYYRVSAVDEEGLESAPSPSISALPVTLLPMEPFGLEFGNNGSTVAFSWLGTTLFGDESDFVNAPPTGDELTGYRIERSTQRAIGFSTVAVLGIGATSYTEAYTGIDYYYRVLSFNDHFTSTSPTVISPSGEQAFFTQDGVSFIAVEGDALEQLKSLTGDPAEAIRIFRDINFAENVGKVINSVRFLAKRGGNTPVENFAFNKPVSIVLRYDTAASGAPIAVSGLAAAGDSSGLTKGAATAANGGYAPAASGLSPAAAGDAAHLGVFWNNGKEYVKQYGKVNTANQTLTVETPNLGSFQVRTQFREQGATFDLSNITTRVITPNGDGRNDVAIMLFDNPKGAVVTGEIFDLRGAKVADMKAGPQPDTLQWDGTANGTVVTSGVYVYQVKGDGKTYNGTFVVAR